MDSRGHNELCSTVSLEKKIASSSLFPIADLRYSMSLCTRAQERSSLGACMFTTTVAFYLKVQACLMQSFKPIYSFCCRLHYLQSPPNPWLTSGSMSYIVPVISRTAQNMIARHKGGISSDTSVTAALSLDPSLTLSLIPRCAMAATQIICLHMGQCTQEIQFTCIVQATWAIPKLMLPF